MPVASDVLSIMWTEAEARLVAWINTLAVQHAHLATVDYGTELREWSRREMEAACARLYEMREGRSQ